ncbi:MAG: adenylate/guanylate cyclase domain-containing protein, partial [Ensifer adhaerens]
DLARKMRLPHYVRVEDLGEHAVRGRGQKLGVLSLRAGSAAPQLASTAAE